jgi:hypothetical protein
VTFVINTFVIFVRQKNVVACSCLAGCAHTPGASAKNKGVWYPTLPRVPHAIEPSPVDRAMSSFAFMHGPAGWTPPLAQLIRARNIRLHSVGRRLFSDAESREYQVEDVLWGSLACEGIERPESTVKIDQDHLMRNRVSVRLGCCL